MPQADSDPPTKPLETPCQGRVGSPTCLDSLVDVSTGFSSALLHDLRQPVSAILFNAQAAIRIVRKDESAGNPLILESLNDIILEVDRLKSLLHGLGTYLGLAEDEPVGLNLNKTVATALGLLAGECIRRQMHLKTDLGAVIPSLQVSTSQLTRAVISLALDLFHALEEAPVSSRQICVSTQVSDGYVKISFQARALTFFQGKATPSPRQHEDWHGRIFHRQEPPEQITWEIAFPFNPT